tara:strand:+ start:3443 stop:4249 length:807 start_codon:yes stop_codon:yes gene_type:complete
MQNDNIDCNFELNELKYDEILNLKDLDDIFEKTLELLPLFLNKYNNLKNITELEKNKFKTDTKIIFKLLHHVFTSESLDDSDIEELDKFQNLCHHLKNIINNIDNMNLDNPNDNDKESLDFINNYFKDQLNEINNQKESLESLKKPLDLLEFSIDLNNKIDKLKDVLKIKSSELSFEDIGLLTKELDYFKSELKNRFDKNLVIETISNLESSNPINYFDIGKTFTDSQVKYTYQEMEKVNRILVIEKLISTVLNIQSKLKLPASNYLS